MCGICGIPMGEYDGAIGRLCRELDGFSKDEPVDGRRSVVDGMGLLRAIIVVEVSLHSIRAHFMAR